MIVCGEPYKETFERYAKELHEIAKPTTTNGKPDRKPYAAIEALANLFAKFAELEVPFRDLDRFCYFIIQSAAQECAQERYAPWGQYGFSLYNCTFGKVFEARPELTPKGYFARCLNNIGFARYGVNSFNEVKVGSFIHDVSEEELLSFRWIGPKTFRQIKDLISKLGLALRNERNLIKIAPPIESHP